MVFTLFTSIFVGCKKDKYETPSAVSIYRIAKEDNSNFSILEAAIDKAGFRQMLDGSDNYTLLAPIDQAFIDAGFADYRAINLADSATIANILKYHIIEGKVDVESLAGGQTLKALNGAELYFDKKEIILPNSNKSTVSFVNGADILGADVSATNGNLQVINRILTPKGADIISVLTSSPNYSLFLAAIKRASTGSRNYLQELSSNKKFTVFAPLNTSFAAFLSGKYLNSTLINTIAPDVVASELVGPHIIENGGYLAYQIPHNSINLSQQRLIVSYSRTIANVANASAGSNTVINSSALAKATANTMASNGVIHGISTIFPIPSANNLLQTIQSDQNLTFLVAAITKASTSSVNFAGLLSSADSYTIFAPNNQAFKDEGFATVDAVSAASVEILSSLLSKHIFEGIIYSTSYPAGSYTLSSINGTAVLFDNSTTGYAAMGPNNSTFGAISTSNTVRSNGVFNIIVKVIK
ncbi:beta-Ig-H3/fasciclin [Arcticibacter svalbardensis MN12-7]|uniref:Beta-Ig-H3/fasciclin n=1 Tax=Arcticibacter svalbardensis MN12-7 TaxID=1150600 RepID=R9GTV1_9SPHI|nr:fasciclin domain-containing protein [Arcticibacter svalbardensis]EOR95277.1 beta-Ig-H3/fasciclin [Arcticibacter svalbardensis MN12-7]